MNNRAAQRNTRARLPEHNFIDLFAGCGGLSLGLMAAGWNGLFAIEKDEMAFDTLQHNLVNGRFKKYKFHKGWWPGGEPRNMSIQEVLRDIEFLGHLRGKIDLVAGGPPCQGFSFAGKRDKDDARNKLLYRYLEFIKLVEPRMLLVENVRGIDVTHCTDGKCNGVNRSYAEKLMRGLERLGYRVYARLHKAVEYGVPQWRPRYIIVGYKKGKEDDVEFPSPPGLSPFQDEARLDTLRRAFLGRKGLDPDRPITTSEAISDLERDGRMNLQERTDGYCQVKYRAPKTGFQLLLHGKMNGTAPNSLRRARHTEKIVKRFEYILENYRRGVQLSEDEKRELGLKKQSIVPLDPGKPSHTITTLPDDIIHYSEPRILTVRENARLQTFPDWFEFRGKYTTGGHRRKAECPRYTQVGNAVPPFLAEYLGLLLTDLDKRLSGK